MQNAQSIQDSFVNLLNERWAILLLTNPTENEKKEFFEQLATWNEQMKETSND